MIKKYFKTKYYSALNKFFGDSVTVLDVGCWDSSVLEQLPRRFKATGLDAYEPIIEKSRTKGFHDDYIVADVTKVQIAPKTYDAVIAIELLEHLEKPESIALLANLEIWAKKKVIVTTPNGFYPFHYSSEDATVSELMAHRCGWTVKEFREHGYTVRGLEGFKVLFNREGFKTLSLITSPIPYFFPSLAFRLLAVKKVL